MNIAIIGNPVTNVSSGKFLIKFSKVISKIAQEVYIINDGEIDIENRKIHVIGTTRFVRKIESIKRSNLTALLGFLMAQFGFTIGLVRYTKKVDVVFVFPIIMFVPVLFAKIMGKKIFLYEAQDIYSEYSKSGLIARLKFFVLWSTRKIVLDLTDYIIVEGKSIIYQNRIEPYQPKTYVCPQFVDKKYRFTKPYAMRENIVGFIATLDKRKGAIEFALAVRQILEFCKELHFVIVGKGPLLNEVKSILMDHVDSDTVQIIEHVPEDSFPEFINELKLCVLPSTHEGLPNIILEAMACGTPVLATPVGAIPDVIKDAETGFIMEDNSPECIAESVMRVLNYPDLDRIVKNAYKLIEEEYTYGAAIRRYKNALARCKEVRR